MSTTTELYTSTNMSEQESNLRIYNTLTRMKEPFEPLTAGHVGIYLCGPTVYKEAHIGHMVGPVIFDCIKRYLTYCGYDVNWVVNITDVDDKLIAQSNERGVPMAQVATEMTMDYCANLLSLGVDQITHMPRATENMDAIIHFISDLIAQNYSYEVDGDVFFDVARNVEYGKLSNRQADQQQGEGGGAVAKKRSAGDFALWKSAKPGEPSWDSPWGPGRPGWHIECSAMSHGILGESFDIHGGGLDLMFPHHENEIAQSECCHGKPMAKYWVHNGLLRANEAGKIGGRSQRESESQEMSEAESAGKMSRSQGAGGLRDLIARHGGDRIRFFLLRTHYRSTIVFNDEAIQEAGTALDRFTTFFERYQRVAGTSFYMADDGSDERNLVTRREQGEVDPGDNPLLLEVKRIRDSFLEKMDDDFNTGAAISDLFQLLTALNKTIDDHQLEDARVRQPEHLASLTRGTETLRELAAILGLFLKPPQITASGGDEQLVDSLMDLMVNLRKNARANKDFATADMIRERLDEIGVSLEDRKDGTEWKLTK